MFKQSIRKIVPVYEWSNLGLEFKLLAKIISVIYYYFKNSLIISFKVFG